MKLILYRFNAPAKEIDVDFITSIDAGQNVITITTNTGTPYIGYHAKFKH